MEIIQHVYNIQYGYLLNKYMDLVSKCHIRRLVIGVYKTGGDLGKTGLASEPVVISGP